IRKRIENAIRESAIEGREYFYLPSMSMNTIIYKGLLLPDQITQYYPDLTDTSVVSALAMIHSRFSTNTFPTWPLAHPYRYICHNGEINTLKGNVNWMRARQGRLQSELFGDDIPTLFPIVYEHQSDSACIDNALELLVMRVRSLAHAMMMRIPEPWADNPQKGRRQPGRMFLVDTVQGRIIDDEEIKAEIVSRKPYRAWVTQYRVSLDELPEPLNVPQPDHPTLRQRQQAFGYTVEELKMVI